MMRLVSDVSVEQVEANEKETRARTPDAKKSLRQAMNEQKLAAAEAASSKKSKKKKLRESEKQGGSAVPGASGKWDRPTSSLSGTTSPPGSVHGSEKSTASELPEKSRKASTLAAGDSRKVSLAIPEESTDIGASADDPPESPVPVPPPPPVRYKRPSSMTIDPSCQHLIVAFDDGSVDIWPIPGLHKGE